MSWVPRVTREEASPEVEEIYDSIGADWCFVPNYFLALGHNAQLLKDRVNLFMNAMFQERSLPRVIKEKVALVVSGLNLSNYCLAAHLEILGRLGFEKSVARKLAMNYRSAPVEPKVMGLFKFAEKLTKRPADMEKARVERLRAAGWKDGDILDLVVVVSIYACANQFSAGMSLVADF